VRDQQLIIDTEQWRGGGRIATKPSKQTLADDVSKEVESGRTLRDNPDLQAPLRKRDDNGRRQTSRNQVLPMVEERKVSHDGCYILRWETRAE
jgi:hypothetical protein